MQFKRRTFFSGLIGLSLPALFPIKAKSIEVPQFGYFPIMQGPTSDTETQIAILIHKSEKISCHLTMGDEKINPISIEVYDWPTSDYVVVQVLFHDLTPDTDYQLHVNNDKAEPLDIRRLKTFSATKKNLRIAFVSCSCDAFRLRSKQMWGALYSKSPDLIVMMGDNVYAGLYLERDPDHVWRRYVQTRTRLSIFREEKLIPSIATWDDHDIGVDGAHRDHKYVEPAMRIFKSFFPQIEKMKNFEQGPGVSNCFTIYGQQFLMLDGRSQRAPTKTEVHYVWGKEQFDWMLSHLNNSHFTWIVNGTQFIGANDEAVNNADPHTLNRLFSAVKQRAGKVCFASGDVHFSEVSTMPVEKTNYQTYELTSSSIHSHINPFEYKEPNNPRRLASTSEYNFLIVDTNGSHTEMNLSIDCVLSKTRSAFQLDLKI
jgi:alkaline phosphatase D